MQWHAAAWQQGGDGKKALASVATHPTVPPCMVAHPTLLSMHAWLAVCLLL